MKTSDQTPELTARLRRLGLYGLLTCCSDIADKPWLEELLAIEEGERQRRSLDRRLRAARIGLGFLEDGVNIILLGPNGVGKTMLLRNIAHQTLVRGHTVRVTTASDYARRARRPREFGGARAETAALHAAATTMHR